MKTETPKIILKKWNELTSEQKATFTTQMKFAGWRDETKYPEMIYQIKGTVCHGWIDKNF